MSQKPHSCYTGKDFSVLEHFKLNITFVFLKRFSEQNQKNRHPHQLMGTGSIQLTPPLLPRSSTFACLVAWRSVEKVTSWRVYKPSRELIPPWKKENHRLKKYVWDMLVPRRVCLNHFGAPSCENFIEFLKGSRMLYIYIYMIIYTRP